MEKTIQKSMQLISFYEPGSYKTLKKWSERLKKALQFYINKKVAITNLKNIRTI
jgi:hypothetical protein